MYSRKRLLSLAMFWLLLGAVAFALSPAFGAVADDRGCSSAPCAFPAENNIGGIILGTDLLEGTGLISFGVDQDFHADLAPNRAQTTEDMIGLGINDIVTGRFFIYKGWYYFDSRVGDSGERVPVHIWADSANASLSGSPNCGNGNANWDGHAQCDFVANISEGYMRYLQAEADCYTGLNCWAVPDTITKSNYWSVNPEDDTCGSLEGLSNACLELIQDGGTCVLGTCVRTGQIRAEDFMLKGHRYKGVRTNGNNKTMTLNDFYLEIRYGKGYDRVSVPQSQHPEGGDWAQPLQTQYGVAAVSVGNTCEGGGPNTNCNIGGAKVGDPPITNSYDNIHQP